jgi:hypothetical protein
VTRRESSLLAVIAVVVVGIATTASLLVRDAHPKSDRNSATAPIEAANLDKEASSSAVDAAAVGSGEDRFADSSQPNTPKREIELDEEVEFAGQIHMRGAPADSWKADGSLVLRNASSSAPPLRLELTVVDGRFQGRGPASAEVEVDRLVLSKREVVTSPATWTLAKRWIEIEGFCDSVLVHVVDDKSGEELSDVELRGRESGIELDPLVGRLDAILQIISKRTSPPGSGYDSPLRLCKRLSFDLRRTPFIVVHAPNHGDGTLPLEPFSAERTVRLAKGASLRVRVQPWPFDVQPERRSVRDRNVVIALMDDRESIPPSVDSTQPTDPLLTLTPASRHMADLIEQSRAARDRIERAYRSPLLRQASLDSNGVAEFVDLPAGRWLAWTGRVGVPLRSAGLVNGRWRPSVLPALLHGDAFVEFTTECGTQSEVVLRRGLAEPPPCIVQVRAVDAVTRESIDLAKIDVIVTPVEFTTVPFVAEIEETLSRSLIERDVIPGSNLSEPRFEVRPGLTTVIVDSRRLPRFDGVQTVVEVVPGVNDVEVALPRASGVLVTIELDKLPGDLYYFATLVRLVRDGDEVRRSLCMVDHADGTRRGFLRYGPLGAGSYELIVPADSGFDRSGTFTLDVRDGELTTFELKVSPSAASK